MRWLVEGMQAEKVREGERCCTCLRHYYLSADQVESSPDEGNKGTCSYNLCTVELIRSVTIIEELFFPGSFFNCAETQISKSARTVFETLCFFFQIIGYLTTYWCTDLWSVCIYLKIFNLYRYPLRLEWYTPPKLYFKTLIHNLYRYTLFALNDIPLQNCFLKPLSTISINTKNHPKLCTSIQHNKIASRKGRVGDTPLRSNRLLKDETSKRDTVTFSLRKLSQGLSIHSIFARPSKLRRFYVVKEGNNEKPRLQYQKNSSRRHFF